MLGSWKERTNAGWLQVHRAYLTMSDESAFRDMFSIQQDPDATAIIDGADDEHPIVLLGDTAEEFTVLCKVLYTP
jgi:hypothetical protein